MPGPPRGRVDPAAEREVLCHGITWAQHLRWSAVQVGEPSSASATDDGVLQHWREEVDPTGCGSFERRLGLAGLSLETAALALDDTRPQDPDASAWREWLEVVVAAYDAEPHSAELDDEDWLAAASAELPAGADQAVPFAHLLWPPCLAACRRLRESESAAVEPLDDGAVRDLQRALLVRLSTVAAPALTELMWSDVPYGRRLLARIGDVPVEPTRTRYAAFCRRVAGTGWASVFTEFPVLASLLATVIRQWVESTEELLRRLAQDRDALQHSLGVPAGARVRAVRTAAGDTHNDGRSVTILDFGGPRLVYKPREVRLEAFLAELCDGLRAVAPAAAVTAPRVLPREDVDGVRYGYAEFVEHTPCRDAATLREFYRDAGRVLALVDLLAGTDCHHENLIADGEHLVLVDAETLFDVAPAGVDAAFPASTPGAGAAEIGTVLRTGLLPTWLWLAGPQRAVDLSALGVRSHEGAGDAVGWRAVNSDAMTRGSVPTAPAPVPTSVPTLQGTPPALADHVDDLVDGFREAVTALATAAPRLMLPLMEGLGTARRRVVVRPTYVYAALLQASLEPEALRSRTARGMVLERLTRAHLGDDAETPWALVEAEQEALARLDVPYFEAPLSGGSIAWLGGTVDGWPVGDGIAALRARLHGVADQGDAKAELVRASVAASDYRMTASPAAGAVAATGPPADRREAAVSWLTALLRRRPSGDAPWPGLALLPDGIHANMQPIGPGLYDGRVGLAVALAECAAHADDVGVAATAVDAAYTTLAPVLELAAGPATRIARAVSAVGPGMAGVGGLLRGLDFLCARGHLDDEVAHAAGAALLSALTPLQLRLDLGLDRLLGAAGLVTPLVRRHHDAAGGDVEALLRAAADVLVERQDADTGGWSTLTARAPLTGLAHGAAGIALALAEAAVCLGEGRYLDSAMRGLAYERNVYDDGARNWPDFRTDAPRGSFMLGWCAGAPGIGLTRLRLLQLLPDHDDAARWRDELRIAAETTAAAPLPARDHVCCGALGQAVVLRALTAEAGTCVRSSSADDIVDAVVARAGASLPVTALGPDARDFVLPGLMTGVPGAALAVLTDDPVPWVSALLL